MIIISNGKKKRITHPDAFYMMNDDRKKEGGKKEDCRASVILVNTCLCKDYSSEGM